MVGNVNPSVSRSNVVRSCSAVGCANKDTKENRARGIRFCRIPVNLEKPRRLSGWRLLVRKILILSAPDAASYLQRLFHSGGKRMQKH